MSIELRCWHKVDDTRIVSVKEGALPIVPAPKQVVSHPTLSAKKCGKDGAPK
jgi:NAD(P)H-dependent flavin oxidoreductase YrpB (nitropropane dioxygenase family)